MKNSKILENSFPKKNPLKTTEKEFLLINPTEKY
jgi:hypothetical protein